jgi:hypothetical protein
MAWARGQSLGSAHVDLVDPRKERPVPERLVGMRNAASEGPVFSRLLARHRALHDLSLPLVRADFDHALDTWQWTLRLDPGAGFALQAAALLHDVERLESETRRRVEHLAPSYDAFKEAHARRGAEIAAALLDEVGAPAAEVERAAWLVCRHELPGEDAELRALNEADALSFLSLNSSGFVDCYGLEHAAMKVRRTLGRLGPAARRRALALHLRADVAALVTRAIAERSGEAR